MKTMSELSRIYWKIKQKLNMQISMEEAIVIAAHYEAQKPEKEATRIKSSRAFWNCHLVKYIFSDRLIPMWLAKAHEGTAIIVDDSWSPEKQFKSIHEFVVKEVENLIEHHFYIPSDRRHPLMISDAARARLLKKNPELIFDLGCNIFHTKENPDCNVSCVPLIDAFIELEKVKHPDFDAIYCDGIEELMVQIKQAIADKKTHLGAVLHAVAFGGRHVVYIDCQLVDGRLSVLQVDGYRIILGGCSIYECLKEALAELPQKFHFMAVQLDLQRTTGGCEIFAFNFAKQVRRNPDCLDQLHAACLLHDPAVSIPETRQWVPAKLMKHQQSSRRVKMYLAKNPDSKGLAINTKHQTLLQYFEAHKRAYLGEERNLSIFDKRHQYLQELRNSI